MKQRTFFGFEDAVLEVMNRRVFFSISADPFVSGPGTVKYLLASIQVNADLIHFCCIAIQYKPC